MLLSTPSANAYVQEPGILAQAGKLIEKFGSNVFIIGGKTAWSKARIALEPSLKAQGISYAYEQFGGECSFEEAERLQKLVPEKAELVIGIGGGKALDTAKLVASSLHKGFVAIPTVAGTCSCVTPLSVVYTPSGLFADCKVYPQNSLLTLVDSDIIADSPVRYMLSGIGDTLAKWYEGVVCARGHETFVPVKLGLAAAKVCLDTLLEYSEQAMKDMESKTTSYAVQQITDTIFISAGSVGGFGSVYTRACGAHGVHDGLTVLEETHTLLHGMKVAYGIIVLMNIDNQSAEEINTLTAYYHKIGLPSNLAELGVKRRLTDDELTHIAEISLSPGSFMQYMPYPVNHERIAQAIRKTE